MCTKQIINAGIVRIVAKRLYADQMGLEMLKGSGISVEIYEQDKVKE
jgi:deoxycytidylate deaminase